MLVEEEIGGAAALETVHDAQHAGRAGRVVARDAAGVIAGERGSARALDAVCQDAVERAQRGVAERWSPVNACARIAGRLGPLDAGATNVGFSWGRRYSPRFVLEPRSRRLRSSGFLAACEFANPRERAPEAAPHSDDRAVSHFANR